MKLSKGIQFFAGGTQTTYDLTNFNLSAGNYAITVVAEAEGYTDSDVSNSVNYTVQAQLATPTIAMNADGKTLEITDVENATSYDVYVDGTLKTNVARITGFTVTFGGTSVSSSEIGNVTVTIPNEQQFQLTNATVVKNNVLTFTLGGNTASDMRVVVNMGGSSTQYEVYEDIVVTVTDTATVYLKNKYEQGEVI